MRLSVFNVCMCVRKGLSRVPTVLLLPYLLAVFQLYCYFQIYWSCSNCIVTSRFIGRVPTVLLLPDLLAVFQLYCYVQIYWPCSNCIVTSRFIGRVPTVLLLPDLLAVFQLYRYVQIYWPCSNCIVTSSIYWPCSNYCYFQVYWGYGYGVLTSLFSYIVAVSFIEWRAHVLFTLFVFAGV